MSFLYQMGRCFKSTLKLDISHRALDHAALAVIGLRQHDTEDQLTENFALCAGHGTIIHNMLSATRPIIAMPQSRP